MNEKKWMCSQCTYMNWEASVKCVLCGNENRVIDQVNQEIYNLSLSQGKSSNISYDNRNKWPCSACTYLNWPKARKCIQCNTLRSKHSSPALSHNSSSDEQINQQKSNKDKSQEQLKKSIDIKSTSSDHVLNQEGKKETPNESFNLSKAFHKWTCVICTYENWPKSKICVMCQSIRQVDENMSHDSKQSENLPIENLTKSKRNNADRHSIDVLWLEACTSIINGNLYAFENYLLAAHGQLDRKLTSQECRILNQPDIFTPGLTLIELAFKLGREDFIELYLASSAANSNKSLLNTQAPQSASSTTGNCTLPHHTTGTIQPSISSPVQRMPCHASPQQAVAIRAHLAESMRMRKGDFPCLVVQEHSTFWLPAELDFLPPMIKKQLLDELVDQHVMRELETSVDEPQVINWWNGGSGHNRLTALWNRTAGDCLLDSVLQSSWGILDRDNVLRSALADSMREAQHIFYPRWRHYEYNQARAFNYTINEIQYRSDWQNLLRIACQQGEPLEQVHIFVLCHILRRPIIVYGVKYINNHRNEPVGFAHFQGVYLPLLWENSYCSRNPIVLGYTRGHFSALVPSETLLNSQNTPVPSSGGLQSTRQRNSYMSPGVDTSPGRGASSYTGITSYSGITGNATTDINTKKSRSTAQRRNTRVPIYQQASNYQLYSTPSARTSNPVCLLPLYDVTKQLLPIHFLSEEESDHCETLLRDWLDVVITRRGFLMARMRCTRRHPLVNELLENWLDLYRESVQDEDDDNEEGDDDDDDEEENEEYDDGGGTYYPLENPSRQTSPPYYTQGATYSRTPVTLSPTQTVISTTKHITSVKPDSQVTTTSTSPSTVSTISNNRRHKSVSPSNNYNNDNNNFNQNNGQFDINNENRSKSPPS